MTNPSNTSNDAERVVVPFMPKLRKKLGARLSPPKRSSS